MSNTAKPAATVMVIRQGKTGPELILLKRSRKVGFFPSAWVFPGGRVDPQDALFPIKGEELRGKDKSFVVAAIRECFEEAGFWLGEGNPAPALRTMLNHREGFLPLDGSLQADGSKMRQWSWWVTPQTEPKRYDTRFYVCVVDEMQEIGHDEMETVASCWISPQEAVAKHEAGEMFMAPPTYITLLELAKYETVQQIWEAAKNRDLVEIQPTHSRENGRLEIRLPGHPNHPVQEQLLSWSLAVLKERRWVLS